MSILVNPGAKMSEVCEYLVDLIQANLSTLGADAVYYGDQEKLNKGVVICVDPDEKNSTLANASSARGVNVEFIVQIFVYHSKIESEIAQRRANDFCAEAVEALIHTKPHLGGLVIHGMVEKIASGYTNKAGTLIKASRLEYRAHTTDRLPLEEG